MKRTGKKLLSLLLTLAMVLSLAPSFAFAAGETYTKVTSLEDLTTGQYVMVVSNGYAPGVYEDKWLTTGQPTIDGETITGASLWTITVNGSSAKLTDSNGVTVKPKNGNSNGIEPGDYDWAVSCTDGTFRFAGTGSDTTTLACNTQTTGNNPANYRFRAYKNTTISNNPDTYPADFTLYKLDGDTPDPGPDPDDGIVTIAEALAAEDGTADLTVKGVVTLVDGSNLYVQDATGGICVRTSATPSDVSLGDTIIGTGKRATYNGLPQLGSSTYELSSGLKLEAEKTTIGALSSEDICTYVKLSGLEITEVYDNNGKYTSPNITLSDGENTIQLYKAVINKNEEGAWEYAVGDIVDVTAAVGIYNTTFQLRNTLASEIQHTAENSGPLADGDRVVIYNPGSGMAVSSEATGTYYRAGVAVTPNGDGTVNAPEALIWDVTVNADGTYTFSHNGDKLSMNNKNNSLPLNEVNDTWTVSEAATENCYYLINANRPTYYVEWFAKYTEFSTYTYNAADESIYALQFLKAAESTPGGELADGSQVVIYNFSAKGVLAGQDDNADSPSIENAAATLNGGMATVANGGRVFTVEKNGAYYRFYNENDGYLCSNGTGNNAFYQKDASEDADWTLAKQGSGYTLESRTAKYNGKYSQYLEYYAGAYKTYSMYNVTDYDIYTFQFYPCANETLTGGIVNEPAAVFGALADAYVGADYTLSFTVDAVFGVKTVSVSLNGEDLPYTLAGGVYTVTIPAAMIAGESLTVVVGGEDNMGVAITGQAVIHVKDEPVISELTPAAGSETGENKRPTISAAIGNAGEDPTVVMTVAGETVQSVYAGGKVSYTPAADLADGRVSVTVTVTRKDGKSASRSWSFTVGEASQRLYFGQLHSHTQYSDGSGTLESALAYVAALPESANVDFVAFTDHSNYFDKSGAANPEGALYDMSLATEYSQGLWSEFKGLIDNFNAEQSDMVALGGFEMTWSGGPGHINTWNTPGIVSRNNTTLNNKTADAGMKAYYALLSQPEGVDSISQFNHPGTTFGNFSDFAYWDALIDSRMYLVEVGNGEGQIGAGGYYPSYEQYTLALDKGWHLAPTNNQDNHKGKWGNANDARDVILTDDFSEQGLYEAIRNYRVYASEDKNLEVYYTVNDLQMGSIIEEVPESLDINVQVNDPDASDSISKVEVVVNSGRVAYTWDDPMELAAGELSCTLDPTYSYYYIRVTEGDGDLAVTAPVWVGETLKLGISSVECGTATPVTGEELTITTTLFNSEATDATVKSVTYTSGSEKLYTDTTGYTVPASGSAPVVFTYTPTTAKVMTVKVTVVMELEGVEYEFSMDITLDVLNADELVYIGIDASHHNEYVAGNYKDSMGNFGNLAAGYSVRTVQLNTSEELLQACANADGKYKMIILTAPSRRDGTALRNPYDTYSDAEIDALVSFSKAGGALVFAGWSDYYESYSAFPAEDHMAAQQNKVLEALGSSLRISDDGVNDNVLNGGQTQRLYFSTYNFDSFLMDGVEFDPENPNNNMYSQLFSHYGGASIYAVDANGEPTSQIPETVTPVVYGHASTYSTDSDKDGLGGSSVPLYTIAEGDSRLMVTATEQLPGQGLIVVSGAAFMSNFEVQATIGDSNAEKNYSNYNICENLVQYLNPVQITPIATVQKQTETGYKYTIEGVVTSNASGYDKDTAFFDCIYIQDETGGICCFPVAGNYKIGDKVRITGTTDFYQGEMELQVTSITLISEGHTVEPKAVTAAQVNDGSVLGSLITLTGTVESFELANGLVQTIMVKDAEGNVARVFIDGYISTAEDVKDLAVGCKISATGLASYDDTFNAPEGPFPRIRIRNRADIVCSENDTPVPPTPPVDPVTPVEPVNPVKPVLPSTPAVPDEPDVPDVQDIWFTDVAEGAWYYDAVRYVTVNGLFNGVSDSEFAPLTPMTRAMMATVLYRLSGADVSAESIFTDVSTSAWYAKAVTWAAGQGVITGYGDGRFGPEDLVTREQVVVMLFRYCSAMGIDVSARGELSVYPDADQVSAYAADAMQWALTCVISGRDSGLLDPKGNATRAELATILQRFHEMTTK